MGMREPTPGKQRLGDFRPVLFDGSIRGSKIGQLERAFAEDPRVFLAAGRFRTGIHITHAEGTTRTIGLVYIGSMQKIVMEQSHLAGLEFEEHYLVGSCILF